MNQSSSSAAETAARETAAERLARYAAEPVTAEHIEILDELARYGRRIAGRAAEEALAQETAAATPGEAGAAARTARAAAIDKFNWMSRCVRLTIDLRARLLNAHNAREKRAAAAASEAARAAAEAQAAASREAEGEAERERLYQFGEALGGFHDIVRRHYGDNEPFHILGAVERWVAERDYETQVKGCSIGELIALLCRDYGVPVDWKDWQNEDWVADAEAILPDGVPEPPPAPDGQPSGGAPPQGRHQFASRPTFP